MAGQYFRGLFITVLIAYQCHHINKQHIPQNSGFILILRCLVFTDKRKYSKNRLFRGLIFELGLKKIVGNKTATGQTTTKIVDNTHQRWSLDYVEGNSTVTETPSVFWRPEALKFYCQRWGCWLKCNRGHGMCTKKWG